MTDNLLPPEGDALDQTILKALMTAPNSLMEKTINDRPLTVFEVQNYKILVDVVQQLIAEARIDELETLTKLPNIQIPAGVHVQARYLSAIEDRIQQLKDAADGRGEPQ